jgi:S-adenosylmethionine hydrolase
MLLELAILKNFDSDTYKAGVQLAGSLTTYLDNLKVARSIPTDKMTPGQYVLIALQESNPKTAVVIAVFDP